MKKGISLLLMLFVVFSLSCSRMQRKSDEFSHILPLSYKIAVAPFTQPIVGSELVTGTIPEQQGKITSASLEILNRDLRSVLLSQNNRSFSFISPADLPKREYPVTGQAGGIKKWLEYGKAHNLEFLLVPQVLDWHDRQGSEAGVTSSASVKLEFFLIDVKNDALTARFTYDEKQVGLIDNILTMGDFMKRKGRWVEATTLAKEGIEKAVVELGL